MVRSTGWVAAALAFGCANSTESARPAPDASMPVAAAQAPAAPEERALPDAGLMLQPMVAPTGTIPAERLELPDPGPAGAAGFRPTQNDTPPPKKPTLHIADRPYSPVPTRPDSSGRMSIPRQDPGAPTVPVTPKGPASTNAPPADR